MDEITNRDIVEANKRFYDEVAPVYDQIDTRRGDDKNHQWLDKFLYKQFTFWEAQNNKSMKDIVFLDAGSGSGFLSYHSAQYIEKFILVDISQKMLDRIQIPKAQKIEADCSNIPIESESVDFVGAFATLHHLFNPNDFFKEAFRILKKGGFLYCDHDIEKSFVKQFKMPLKIYRMFFDHGKNYLETCPELEKSDYHLSEYHGDSGIDGNESVDQLKQIGFSKIQFSCHWEGSGFPEKILRIFALKKLFSKPRFAPLLRICAIK